MPTFLNIGDFFVMKKGQMLPDLRIDPGSIYIGVVVDKRLNSFFEGQEDSYVYHSLPIYTYAPNHADLFLQFIAEGYFTPEEKILLASANADMFSARTLKEFHKARKIYQETNLVRQAEAFTLKSFENEVLLFLPTRENFLSLYDESALYRQQQKDPFSLQVTLAEEHRNQFIFCLNQFLFANKQKFPAIPTAPFM